MSADMMTPVTDDKSKERCDAETMGTPTGSIWRTCRLLCRAGARGVGHDQRNRKNTPHEWRHTANRSKEVYDALAAI